MSENVLLILLRVFAIIAREDGVTEEERDVVRRFLEDHLSGAEVGRYMDRLAEFIQEADAAEAKGVAGGAGAVCRAAAAELTVKQQMVLLMYLLELVQADGTVSAGEERHLAEVVAGLALRAEWVAALRSFVLAQGPEDLRGDGVLVVTEGSVGVGGDGRVLRDASPGAQHDGREGTKVLQAPMHGVIGVLNIGEGQLYLIKYFGQEYLQLNHQYLAPRKNLVLRHGSVIGLPHGHTLYFSDIMRQFLPIGEEDRISMVCEGVEFRFPRGGQGLQAVDLVEGSGRLVAIMGASGSGKSTLLNVLNGNLRPSKGRVLVNGQDLHAQLGRLRGLIGYVPQDDLLMEDLTVYQNLYFNARLCHKEMDAAALDGLVMRTLNDLGLSETKDLRVGNPLEKTISGGQRKRLNIGLELLRAPAIIFFDEPTSGLSSRDSENIMDLLKELSFKGKLIFVVIHQPSSDIFKLFDSLLVLDTGGYPIYYGNPVEAVVYFRRMSEQVSQHAAACEECGNINPEQIFSIVEARVVDEYGNLTAKRKVGPKGWNEMYLAERGRKEGGARSGGSASGGGVGVQSQTVFAFAAPSRRPFQDDRDRGKGPGWLRQVGVFLKRDLLSKLGNRQYLMINVAQAPLLAVILAVLVRHSEGGEAGIAGAYLYGKNENIPAFFFMSIVVALFIGMTMSAEEIFRDRKILKRESFLALSRSGYLISKTAVLFGFSAVQMGAFALIGALILELPGLYVSYWLMLFSLACFAVMLGLNVSATFNSAVTIYILIPLLLIPQLILSGTVVRFDRLNPGFSSPKEVPLAADLMASRWAYEGLMVRFFKDNAYQSPFFAADAVASEAVYRKDYWVPRMRALVNYCERHVGEGEEALGGRLEILRWETKALLRELPKPGLACHAELNAGKFDGEIAGCLNGYLEAVENHYMGEFNKAKRVAERENASLTARFASAEEVTAFRNAYDNSAIGKLVRNSDSGTRLLEQDGELVRTFEPIYHRLHGRSPLNYRTHFYAAEKPFLGVRWDTFAFNLAVVWGMTLVLYVALYFEAFRRVGRWIGGRGRG